MIEPDDNTLTQAFRVEVLTPTHVGGASENHWQAGLDFITRDSKTWILDFEKLGRSFPVELSRALAGESNSQTLNDLLRGKNLESYALKSFTGSVSYGEIKRHIFNGLDGKPFLPGSSLKGSVSSIFLNHFYRKFDLRGGNDIVKNVLGNFENSIMRFFQFTDVSFEESQLIPTKIFNLQKNNGRVWEGGWKQSGRETNSQFSPSGFTTTYECIEPRQNAELTISFKHKKVGQLYNPALPGSLNSAMPPAHTGVWLTSFDFEKFCKLVNGHTLAFLGKEIAFFEKYSFDANTESVLKNLRALSVEAQNLDSAKECILRLAAGSGFHSITGDWQYDDFVETGDHDRGKNAGKRKYKSRKLAFDKDSAGQWEFWPMGFVKLSMISQEDIERAERERIDEEKAKAQAAQAARQQAEAEAEAVRRTEEEARKPQPFTGKVKQKAEMDAVVVGFDKKNLVELFIEGQENKPIPMIYGSPIDVGKVVIVKVNQIDKKGRVIDVHFKGYK